MENKKQKNEIVMEPQCSRITLRLDFKNNIERSIIENDMRSLHPLQKIVQNGSHYFEGSIEDVYVRITPEYMRIGRYFENGCINLVSCVEELENILHIMLGACVIENLGMKLGVHIGDMTNEYLEQIDGVFNFQRMIPSLEAWDIFQTPTRFRLLDFLCTKPVLSYFAHDRIFNIFINEVDAGDKRPDVIFELVCFNSYLRWLENKPLAELDMRGSIERFYMRELCHVMMLIKYQDSFSGERRQTNSELISFMEALRKKIANIYMN